MITRQWFSVAQNRCGTSKLWQNVMTVLAQFRGGFSVSLKNFGGFMVFGDSLRPQPWVIKYMGGQGTPKVMAALNHKMRVCMR